MVFVVAYCLVNVDSFTSLFARIGEVLTPVLIGCVLAYFLNPILKFWEYIVFRKMGKGNLRLGLSLLCTYLTAIAILAGLVALIIPEPLERERLVDKIRWMKIDDLESCHNLDFVTLCAYRLRLDMLEKYRKRNAGNGNQLFEDTVARLASPIDRM